MKILPYFLFLLFFSCKQVPPPQQKERVAVKETNFANYAKYKEANQLLQSTGNIPDLVFMGDSITEIWPQADASFFSENNFVGRGIGGQTTSQMLLRFREDVIKLKPKAVVILGGINDIARNNGEISIDHTFNNIVSMAQLARAAKIQVFVCSVLPALDFPWRPGLSPAAKVIELNALLKSFCAENFIPYIDFYTPMEDGSGGLKVPDFTSADDLVHPNKEGYKLMKKILMEKYKKMGC